MASEDHVNGGTWKCARLSEISETIVDCPHTTPDYLETGVPVVGTTAVRNGKLVKDELKYTSKVEYELRIERLEPRPGDVVFTREAPVGETCVIPPQTRLSLGQRMMLIRPDEKRLDARYLVYCIYSDFVRKRLAAISGGSTNPHVNVGEIRDLAIPLPPLKQQKFIADALESIDEAIEATRAVIDQTRRLKTAILQDLLTKGLPGRHKKFKNDRCFGRIPADWAVKKLGQIAKVARGKFTHRPRNDPEYYGGNIPFVQTGDVVGSGDYLREHSQTLNELGLTVSRMFPQGTILFVIAGSVGACTIADYDVAFPDSIVGIEPLSGIETLFLLRQIQASRERIIRTATESAQANLSLELLTPILFPVPPMEEQLEISAIIRAVEERVEQECNTLRQCVALKSALSQGLLTGRINVKGGG